MSTRSKIEFKDEKLQDISLLYLDRLTEILSDDDIWINLAKQMGFRANDIENFQKIARDRRESPVKEVILKWSDYGHTITELFVVLSRIGATRAMEAIKPLVDKKFHRLILPDPVRAEEPSKSNFQQTRREHKHQNTQVFSNDNNESVATGPRSDQKEAKPADVNSITHQLQNLGIYTSSIPEIDFRELQDATNNWSTENILGKGGFGTVFKGIWKYTAVAIKKVENRAGESLEMTKIQLQQSLNELMFLNSFRHDNILPLYGFSMNGREPCLVYQLMTEGSLENRLNPSRKDQLLDWNQRLKILRGSARGIQYLHTMKKPLIHGDIKPANILLDSTLEAKLGDFGLSREGQTGVGIEVSRVFGTKPYLPYEFLAKKILSTKVDVYSFGVVLFEVATGLRAYDHKRHHRFLTNHLANITNAKTEDLIDKSVDFDERCLKICERAITLGRFCTSNEPHNRPEMVFVLTNLDANI